MDLSDLETLLQPISDDQPCGPDLEYDADFGEMERAAQSKSEQQYGDTIVAAEPPDWKDVKRRALALLDRTKDMRVVTYLARAVLHQDGIVGFEQAIGLLRGYVETYWDSVHPELDHDDDDDPTYRTNTLIMLCDEETFVRDLRETPLVSSRAMGQFSLRDTHRAHEAPAAPVEETESSWGDEGGGGEAKPKGPSPAAIEAAFTDASIEDIQATEAATRLAAEHLAAIEQFVTEQVGVGLAVSLSPPRSVLEEMNQIVLAQLERRGVSTGGEDEAEEAEVADDSWGDSGAAAGGGETSPAATAAAVQGYRVNGKITSRKDAIKALDDVCEFYEENEPSSPLPLLIRRAQRLASKSFLDILRDLAPDAVSQAEALGGGIASESSGGYAESTEESAGESEESSSW
ncbi:type VI secretion system protein TssA [Stieleria sp. TO1_6]|uniref:type VI secretion system protein TssA n=1 Tax=Stieleria tagensis TaxID=2956795 RepID=UPI00209B58E5|nr:type VI secretion system protein TssA [Stieleria tagensis]MCO8120412.1 type VI secretion system protein TssA [Stieleria tagensis]